MSFATNRADRIRDSAKATSAADLKLCLEASFAHITIRMPQILERIRFVRPEILPRQASSVRISSAPSGVEMLESHGAFEH
jgi:hypothetical protein